MFVLGIETSGLEGSIALLRDGQCLGERHLNQVGRRHAQSLVLEVGELLQAHSLSSRDVDLVAVSRGPGSFTGLRVGMVFAKTFAYATSCRFIAVDTFAAIAENVPAEIHRLIVIEDAQRDDLFAGEYIRDESQRWRLVAPIAIVSMNEFLNARVNSENVTGPGVNKRGFPGETSIFLKDPAVTKPRAVMIAKLGGRDFPQGNDHESSSETDFWRASPFYLRLSAAEEKRVSQDVKDGRVGGLP
jgi:tRNA threonylcarbamoyladenosine biosynthesis protein TsaB